MKFRKKPVEVEAMQFTVESKDQVFNFVCGNKHAEFDANLNPVLVIETKEGDMKAVLGDWVIKEPFPTRDRNYYPCKPDIFEQTYEQVTP